MSIYPVLSNQNRQTQSAQDNLRFYLGNLQGLLTNNLDVKALLAQKAILMSSVRHREMCLYDLYGDNWQQIIPRKNSDSPQCRAYREEIRQLGMINERLSVCHAAYEDNFLASVSHYRAAKNHGRYSLQVDTLETTPLKSPLYENLPDQWPEHYCPDLTELILLRHLAKNNMRHIGEAYPVLIKSLQAPATHKDLPGLQALHDWLIQNPAYAGILSTVLLQLYNIVISSPGVFGQAVVKNVHRLKQTLSLQALVNKFVNETSQTWTLSADICLPPYLLALLHLAQITPWLLAEEEKHVHRQKAKIKSLFDHILQDTELGQQAVILVLALLKPSQVVDDSGTPTVYQRNQVMLHMLLKCMRASGGLAGRRKAIQDYLLKRQALQRVAIFANQCFNNARLGRLSCLRLRVKEAAKSLIPKSQDLMNQKVIMGLISVSIMAITAACLSATPESSVVVRVLEMESMGLLALGVILIKADKVVQSSDSSPQSNSADFSEYQDNKLRIKQALENLEKEALCESPMGKGRLNESLTNNSALMDQLTNTMISMEKDDPAEAFSATMTDYAAKQRQALTQAYTDSRQRLISCTLDYLVGTDITSDELSQLVTEIDIALMLDGD